MALLLAAAFGLVPASASAEVTLGGNWSFGQPEEEGDWKVTGTSSELSTHSSSASGEVRIEQTGPATLRITALTDVTLTGSDGSSCHIADPKSKVAEVTYTEGSGTFDTGLFGRGLTGAAERYEDEDELPEVRCTGSTRTNLWLTGPGSSQLLEVRPPFGSPSYSGMYYLLSFERHPTVSYVALGDSYSSGEGAGGYDKGAGRCHRSSSAWPRLLAELTQKAPLETAPHLEMRAFLACSGAEIPQVEDQAQFGQPAQLPQLKSLHPGFVTMSIGGNDVGFGAILRKCFISDNCLSDGSHRGKGGASPLQAALDRIDNLKGKLVKIYGKVAGELVDRHRLVIVGYPDLIPVGTDRCGWMSQAEQAHLGELSARLEETLQRATEQAKVRYLSLRGVTSGHEMCSKHSWYVDITTRRVVSRLLAKLIAKNKLQELGHPRASAQNAIARYVAENLDPSLLSAG